MNASALVLFINFHHSLGCWPSTTTPSYCSNVRRLCVKGRSCPQSNGYRTIDVTNRLHQHSKLWFATPHEVQQCAQAGQQSQA